MPKTTNTSSSRPTDDRLIEVQLTALHAHPLNANSMSPERLEKLQRNIAKEGRYPPVVVRSHPDLPGQYQILDGHQRCQVLRNLGHQTAVCFPWECDDQTALLLLATLNRLEGEDMPARRAELLSKLTALLPAEDLGLLLPESAEQIEDMLSLFALDGDGLLAELKKASERARDEAPRMLSFVLSAEDEADVTAALEKASSKLGGSNRRGRSLGLIARYYLEDGSNG